MEVEGSNRMKALSRLLATTSPALWGCCLCLVEHSDEPKWLWFLKQGFCSELPIWGKALLMGESQSHGAHPSQVAF